MILILSVFFWRKDVKKRKDVKNCYLKVSKGWISSQLSQCFHVGRFLGKTWQDKCRKNTGMDFFQHPTLHVLRPIDRNLEGIWFRIVNFRIYGSGFDRYPIHRSINNLQRFPSPGFFSHRVVDLPLNPNL